MVLCLFFLCSLTSQHGQVCWPSCPPPLQHLGFQPQLGLIPNKNRSAGQVGVWALLFIKSGLGPEIIQDIFGPPLVEPGAAELFFIQQKPMDCESLGLTVLEVKRYFCCMCGFSCCGAHGREWNPQTVLL